MTDDDFYEELRQMVERRAVAMHLVDTIAFVDEVAERLDEDPVFGEFVPLEFSGTGRRNRQFRIHGYTRLDESDGSIGLVIARWSDADRPETLASAAVVQLASMLENFVHESVAESLVDRTAEANGAYELAMLLKNAGSRITRIRLHIFSNQPLSVRFREQLGEPIAGMAIEQHVWDLQRLRALYESSREREVVELDMTQFGPRGIECMRAARTPSIESYLCMLSGDTLADLFERYGSRLLEGNVRSFLGMKGGVNKGIRRTIQDAPELFFAFNNGIAATASSVTTETAGGRTYVTHLVDLQIVNGGQTTASILNARKKDRLSLDGVSVAMKLTVVQAGGAGELIPRIAEYANTQNKVAVADFFANHPFHRKMEEISRRLVIPATEASRVQSKWFYERSRGQYQNERLYLSEARKRNFDAEFPASQVINKTDLAKYDGVLNQRPHVVSLGAQKNFIRFASAFESKDPDVTPTEYWASISPRFGDAYYQRIVAAAILWRRAEVLVSDGRRDWYAGDYRAQIVAYGLAILVHAIERSGNGLDAGLIWSTQSVPADLLVHMRLAAISAQKAILNPPSGMTNVGEWTKREACWEAAKSMEFEVPSSAKWMASRDWLTKKRTEARKQGFQDDGIALQGRLLELAGSGYWASLMRWPSISGVATEAQRVLVARASTLQGFMKITTEKDWRRLAEIQHACEEAGFRGTTSA